MVFCGIFDLSTRMEEKTWKKYLALSKSIGYG